MSQQVTADNTSEWLNKKIFNDVIMNDLKLASHEFQIISVDSAPAVKPGDNHLAVMFRTTAVVQLNTGEVKSVSYIVKCLLPSLKREFMAKEFHAFPKEKKMYAELIPAFEKLYADVGQIVSFGPKCFYTADDPAQIIVLEDLSSYEMKDKKLGLDRVHVEKGLEWLAKFHAASMVFRKRKGDFGEDFKTGVFNPSLESIFQPYYDGYFDHYLAKLRSLENAEKYAEKAEQLRGKLYSMMCKTLAYDERAFNVLCHGDMWTNNLLFLYHDDGEIKDLKTVDYQVMFWGSVAKDIYYFMMTSWQLDFKVEKFDELVKFYYLELSRNLGVLRYEGRMPTHEELRSELRKKKLLAAGMTLESLVFPCCEVDSSDENFAKMIYENFKAENSLATILPWLDKQNAFDF